MNWTHGLTFLPTLDMERTHAFLHGILGLPLVLDQGACRIYRAGSAYWGFCESISPLADPSAVILTLVTDDVPASHAALSAQGVITDGAARVNERFQIEHFFTATPEGYRLEVQRFLDPAWQE